MKKVLIIGLLVLILLAIRYFQDTLFYDPLIEFFKSDFTNKPLPQMKSTAFYGSLFFRYFLNTLVSIGIIYVVFREKSYLGFSAIFYTIAFVILLSAFWFLYNSNDPNYLAIFYVRRFLIQPLFLLILIPGLLYIKHSPKED